MYFETLDLDPHRMDVDPQPWFIDDLSFAFLKLTDVKAQNI